MFLGFLGMNVAGTGGICVSMAEVFRSKSKKRGDLMRLALTSATDTTSLSNGGRSGPWKMEK